MLRQPPRAALIVGLLLATGIPALCGCPAHRTASGGIPPTHTYERRLGEYLEETLVGDVPLGEYLTYLEVQGCLELEESELLGALSGLRSLHRQAYEHASNGAHSFTKIHQIRVVREWQQLERRLWWLWVVSAPAIREH